MNASFFLNVSIAKISIEGSPNEIIQILKNKLIDNLKQKMINKERILTSQLYNELINNE